MKRSPLPYKQVIFVCTNARLPGERVSCAGAGRCGQVVLDRLKDHVKANGLQQVARVAKSGCQEQCESGPSVMLLPQNEHLSGVDERDVETIIESYLDPATLLT